MSGQATHKSCRRISESCISSRGRHGDSFAKSQIDYDFAIHFTGLASREHSLTSDDYLSFCQGTVSCMKSQLSRMSFNGSSFRVCHLFEWH